MQDEVMAETTDAVDKTKTTSPLVGLVSGCAGAVALVYVGQPLDTVKVRMQLSTATQASSTGGVSMWGCVRDMWRQASVAPASQHSRPNNTAALVGGGLHVEACSLPYATAGRIGKVATARRMTRLMYAGTAPALMANVAENGVLFAAYGPCQRLVAFTIGLFDGSGGIAANGVEKKLGPASMATAGSLASFCSAFALCPTELIKVRLQAADLERSNGEAAGKRPMPASGALQVVARVWKTEGGLRGMYRGMGSTVAREMPGYYVFFLAYEASRTYLNEWHYRTAGSVKTNNIVASGGHDGNAADPAWVTMVAGAAAGIGLWLFVYPVDAIKSRIQATGGGSAESSGSGSFLKTLVQSVRNEGPLALYRGLAPTLLRTVPASAVMFWTIERTTTLLSGYGL